MLAAWMIAMAVLQAGQPQPEDPRSQGQVPLGGWPGPGPVVKAMMAQAEKLAPLVKSERARRFLEVARELPEPGAMVVYRDAARTKALSPKRWAALPEAERAGYTKKEYPPEFYYSTGYGSPLVYVRLVDLMAEHWTLKDGPRRVLDFGYGSIGQLLLMADMDWTAIGVDVEPVFGVIYERYSFDTPLGKENGLARVLEGRWPAEPGLVKAVGSGGAYDVITSKNTLKAGYIHPKPPAGKTVDEKQLVKLGVEDDAYLKAVHDALKPGGLFILYNISPAQSPAEDLTKPYIPWADGKSPFTREQLEGAGFEVVRFDQDDQAWVLDCWKVLGYDEGKAREEAAKDVFAWYTVARRK